MLELHDESKIILKLLVILKNMFLAASWIGVTERLQPRTYFFNHKYFIDFALIIQFQHKGYLNFWLDMISFSFTTGYLCMCVICKKTYRFPPQFLAQLSATMSSLRGYQFHFVISNTGSNTSVSIWHMCVIITT